MSKTIRATKHNGRTKKHTNVAYSSKHNDRQYKDKSHLKKSSDDNLYYINGFNYFLTHKEYVAWTEEQHENEQVGTFEEYENLFYEKMFKDQYNQQMERHIKGGHKDRVKTFDDWKKDKRYVPEETQLQVGNKDIQIPRETSEKIFLEYFKWEQKWGYEHECFQILDMAIHEDETTIHSQSRRVWFSLNPETGIYEIGQEKALERAGIPLPDTTKPRSRYNNRKMVFDKLAREQFLSICEAYGVDVERVPIPDGSHNLDKDEMIHRKHTEKEKELDQRDELLVEKEKQLERKKEVLVERQKQLEKKNKVLVEKEKTVNKLHNALLNDLQTVKGILDTYSMENVENEQIRALEEELSNIKYRDGSTALERYRRKQEAKKREIRRDTANMDEIMERWNIHKTSNGFEMGN